MWDKKIPTVMTMMNLLSGILGWWPMLGESAAQNEGGRRACEVVNDEEMKEQELTTFSPKRRVVRREQEQRWLSLTYVTKITNILNE